MKTTTIVGNAKKRENKKIALIKENTRLINQLSLLTYQNSIKQCKIFVHSWLKKHEENMCVSVISWYRYNFFFYKQNTWSLNNFFCLHNNWFNKSFTDFKTIECDLHRTENMLWYCFKIFNQCSKHLLFCW